MNEQPFIIFQNSNFLIIYKPPYWKLDISDKYEKISIKKPYKKYGSLLNPMLQLEYTILKIYNKKTRSFSTYLRHSKPLTNQ